MLSTRKLFYLHFLLLLKLYYIIVTIRLRLIKNTDRHLLPKVYINLNDFLLEPSYIGKIKIKYLVTAWIHLFRSRVQLFPSILGFH